MSELSRSIAEEKEVFSEDSGREDPETQNVKAENSSQLN